MIIQFEVILSYLVEGIWIFFGLEKFSPLSLMAYSVLNI